jgi:membrane protease YdiL (CAAX protease family)
MSDDKKGWLHSEIYDKSFWPKAQPARTSIFKFGSFGDLARNALKIAGQSLIAWFLFALLLIFLLDPAMKNNAPYYLATEEIVKLVCTTISVFLVVKVLDGSDLVDIGLKLDGQAFRDFFVGFALVTFVLGLEFISYLDLGWLSVEHVAWEKLPFAALLWNMVVILVIFVFVGWSEELLSRGFHLRIIAKGLNRPLGIILSSVIFSWLHRGNPDMTPRSYILIFLFGIVCALAFLRTGQLWMAMGLHAGWDIFVTLFWGTPISGLRLFHLLDISIARPSSTASLFEFLDLLVIAVFIRILTMDRKPPVRDW